MPLRSAPLPRMAGQLSFMRAQTKAICDVRPDDLAVLGVPFEDTSAPYAGQSLAPRALRETSVIFALLLGTVLLKEKLTVMKALVVIIILTGVITLRLA